MIRVETLFLSQDPNFYNTYFKTALEPSRFIVNKAATLEKAKAIIHRANGAIASIFLDITDIAAQDAAEYLHELRAPTFPEVVLCIKTSKNDDKTFAFPIVDYVRGGAYGVLKLPTYESEILWVAKKTVTLYLTRKQVVDSMAHPDYSARMTQFYALLTARKKRGLPLSYTELELFFLPKKDALNATSIMDKVTKPPIADYKNITILIVEDEIKTSKMYQAYLEQNCYTVEIANSGKEAKEKLANIPHINVVILDVELGDMTGTDLIPLIKETHSKAEIIMVTAFSEFDLISNTLQLGAFDFLVKSETDLALLNQKIIQAIHKRYFEDFFQSYLTKD